MNWDIFLLPLAEPGEDFVFESGSTRVESIHNQLHQAFVSGQEFGNGAIYFRLRSILGYDVAIEGSEFQQEIDLPLEFSLKNIETSSMPNIILTQTISEWRQGLSNSSSIHQFVRTLT